MRNLPQTHCPTSAFKPLISVSSDSVFPSAEWVQGWDSVTMNRGSETLLHGGVPVFSLLPGLTKFASYQTKYKWHLAKSDPGTQSKRRSGDKPCPSPCCVQSSVQFTVWPDAGASALNSGGWGMLSWWGLALQESDVVPLQHDFIHEWHGGCGWKAPLEVARVAACPLPSMWLSSGPVLSSVPREAGRFLHRPRVLAPCGSGPSQAGWFVNVLNSSTLDSLTTDWCFVSLPDTPAQKAGFTHAAGSGLFHFWKIAPSR